MAEEKGGLFILQDGTYSLEHIALDQGIHHGLQNLAEKAKVSGWKEFLNAAINNYDSALTPENNYILRKKKILRVMEAPTSPAGFNSLFMRINIERDSIGELFHKKREPLVSIFHDLQYSDTRSERYESIVFERKIG